jgi:hypothetical protein
MGRPAAGAAAAAVVLAIAGAGCGERPYDPSFDASVPEPAYRTEHPVVLVDEAHRNSHTATGAYKPFADLLRADGYEVRPARAAFTSSSLAGAAVLVVAGARGTNDTEDGPAFDEAEAAAVERWVREGGALLLVTDHWPYGAAVSAFARRFGVTMGAGLVEDSLGHDPDRGPSHIVFSRVNGLLRDHPIVLGRDEHDGLRRILSFTGQSVAAPPPAVAFLALSDHAIERPPGPARAVKRGGDVRVEMEYGDPISAAGRAQGVALEFGRGRVVVLGEAGMLRAQKEKNGSLVGMNVPGYDDRQLALNVVRWLSRAL